MHMTYNDLYLIYRNLRTRGDGRLRGASSQEKTELASWLIKVLRNTCLAIQSGLLRSTTLLIANRFHMCSSPGSLDNYAQMMQIFDEQFTSDFMQCVAPVECRPTCVSSPHPKPEVPDVSELPASPVWPTPVSEDLAKQCAKAYHDGTVWTRPPTCAVCARERPDTPMKQCHIRDDATSLPLSLDVLRLTNPYIIDKLGDADTFKFGHALLDDLMLAKEGIARDDARSRTVLSICNHCHSALTSGRTVPLPKHSLKNNLYRGSLPERFRDLTWIEEQVCAIYRSTAFVTRLHYMNDPKHPHVLHGNTCAFDQNVVSTANVLPR
jgi:hypothetical protein